MSTPIQALHLTVRTENCLLNDEIRTVESLIAYFRTGGLNGLLKIPNMGRLSQNEVVERLIQWLTADKETSPQVIQDMSGNAALRDQIAVRAMQELIHGVRASSADESIEKLAARSYLVADAMLRARGTK